MYNLRKRGLVARLGDAERLGDAVVGKVDKIDQSAALGFRIFVDGESQCLLTHGCSRSRYGMQPQCSVLGDFDTIVQIGVQRNADRTALGTYRQRLGGSDNQYAATVVNEVERFHQYLAAAVACEHNDRAAFDDRKRQRNHYESARFVGTLDGGFQSVLRQCFYRSRAARALNRIGYTVSAARCATNRIRIGESYIERCIFRYREARSVGQCELYGAFRYLDRREHRIAAVLTIFAGRLAEVGPCPAAVGRNIPVAVLDFKLRGDAVLTVSSVVALVAFLAVRACCLHLVARGVEKPLPVKCPVVKPVRILSNADNRCSAVLTVRTVHSVFAVLAVIDSYRRTLDE